MTDPIFDIDASSGAEVSLKAWEMGGDNQPVFSVSELSHSLKRVVEDAFAHVRVRGEGIPTDPRPVGPYVCHLEGRERCP